MGHSVELPLFAELLEPAAEVASTAAQQSTKLPDSQQYTGTTAHTKQKAVGDNTLVASTAELLYAASFESQTISTLNSTTDPRTKSPARTCSSQFHKPPVDISRQLSKKLATEVQSLESRPQPAASTADLYNLATPQTIEPTPKDSSQTNGILEQQPLSTLEHKRTATNQQDVPTSRLTAKTTTALFQAQQQDLLATAMPTDPQVQDLATINQHAGKLTRIPSTAPCATTQPWLTTTPALAKSNMLRTTELTIQPQQFPSRVDMPTALVDATLDRASSLPQTTANHTAVAEGGIVPEIREYAVSELAGLIKHNLESEWSYIRVKGEISGLKYNNSGHIYFNLKDDKALLNVVCFRNIAATLELKLAEGQEVVVGGKLTTYTERSNYQLNAETIRYSGIGAILQQLALLKERLSKEGLFNPAHKLPLPTYPWHLGLITSATGSVIQDMLHRLRDRFPTQVYLYPVPVQGKEASQAIIRGLRFFQHTTITKVDLLIIARGGGSLEDLLPFSDEALLRAVYQCTIPTVSAIGHETDFPLLDLVADLRAPTPTAAIELTTPVATELSQNLHVQRQHLREAIQHCHQSRLHTMDRLIARRQLRGQHLYRKIEQLANLIQLGKAKFEQRFQQIFQQLKLTQQRIRHTIQHNLAQCQQQLLRFNRFAVIKQQCFQQIESLQREMLVRLHTNLEQLHTTIVTKQQQSQQLQLQLHNRLHILLQQVCSQVAVNRQTLRQHDLQQLLDRGYSILYDPTNQHPIYTTTELTPDMEINIHYRGYNIRAKILDLQPLPTTTQ